MGFRARYARAPELHRDDTVIRHMIGINQDEFVQQADRHGVITTRHARSATIFHGQDLLKAITLTIHHEPEAIITLFPKSAVATQ